MRPTRFECPRCETRIQATTATAVDRLEQVGACQGCRALETLLRRPELLGTMVKFWERNGFPTSDSWLRGLPAHSPEGRARPPGRGRALRSSRVEAGTRPVVGGIGRVH